MFILAIWQRVHAPHHAPNKKDHLPKKIDLHKYGKRDTYIYLWDGTRLSSRILFVRVQKLRIII